MKYFSIDYRSPPSGMGQVIDTTQPETIIDGNGNEVYNYSLVTYSGNGSENDPSYISTVHFNSQEAYDQGWVGPVLPQIIQYLRDQGVTHVHDGELSYEYPGADSEGFFPLTAWNTIMKTFG